MEYKPVSGAQGRRGTGIFQECCVQKPEVTIRIRELFKAYQDWCDDNNEHAVSERFFGLHLKEMGFEQRRTSDARYWSGLALLEK